MPSRNVVYPFRPDIAFLGDPHLGKRFVTGVALNRRGERELSQHTDFIHSLHDVEGKRAHVMLGDLFDTDIVSNSVLLDTVKGYLQAAKAFPSVTYVLVEGNHDAGASETKVTSFDILKQAVAHQSNIYVIPNNTVSEIDGVTYFGWSRTGYDTNDANTSVVVGHWDVVDFGGHNIVPDFDAAVVGHIVTGHDHVRRTVGRVKVVGSMQPYAHGQDPHQEIYMTLSLAEYEACNLDLTNKSVRFALQKGETAPELDCLQRTWIYDGVDPDEEFSSDLEFDFDFDVKSALNNEMMSRKIDTFVITEISCIFMEAQVHE